jgi:hypothetical protein
MIFHDSRMILHDSRENLYRVSLHDSKVIFHGFRVRPDISKGVSATSEENIYSSTRSF